MKATWPALARPALTSGSLPLRTLSQTPRLGQLCPCPISPRSPPRMALSPWGRAHRSPVKRRCFFTRAWITLGVLLLRYILVGRRSQDAAEIQGCLLLGKVAAPRWVEALGTTSSRVPVPPVTRTAEAARPSGLQQGFPCPADVPARSETSKSRVFWKAKRQRRERGGSWGWAIRGAALAWSSPLGCLGRTCSRGSSGGTLPTVGSSSLRISFSTDLAKQL